MKIKYFIFIIVLLITAQLHAIETTTLEKSEELLNHAKTYNWLARTKTSNSQDFLKAKSYAEQALDVLANENTEEATKQKMVLNSFIADLDIKYDNNYDNIVNEVPLFSLITRRQNTFEYFDDPAVVATGRALELTLSKFVGSKLDIQFDTIVVSQPDSPGLEDEIRYSLGQDNRFFPRGDEDISSILNLREQTSLSIVDKAPAVLSKLANAWGKRYLAYFQLVFHDEVNDVVYYGIYLRIFDSENNQFIQSVYSDGFCQNRLNILPTILVSFLVSLLLFLITAFSTRVLCWFHSSRKRGSIFWFSGLIGGISGLSISGLIIWGLGAVAPDGDSLFITLFPNIWFFGFVFLLTTLPAILTYLISSRLPGVRDRLAGSWTLGTLFSSSLSGKTIILFLLYVIYNNGVSAPIHSILLLFSTIIGGFILGVSVYQRFYENEKVAIIPSIIVIIALFLQLRGFLLQRNDLEIVWTGIILLLYIFYSLRLKFGFSLFAVDSAIKESEEEKERLEISQVKRWCQKPVLYIDPSNSGDFIESQIEYYTKFLNEYNLKAKKSSTPFFCYKIIGENGIGKTRTAIELGNQLLDSYFKEFGKQGKVLFGDCDEMNKDGSGVPFEPLAQAFHGLFSAGRFEPPGKRASKIAEGLKQVGLENALGAFGLGALNSLLGLAGEKESDATGSIGEIAFTLSQALLEISKDAPAVLIIDDIHFIDGLSSELLNQLIYNITIARNSQRIILILTSNENGYKSPGTMEIDSRISAYTESGALVLKTINKDSLVNPSRFDEFLIHSLKFSTDSTYRFLHNIEQYQPVTILGLLQLAESVLNLDGAYVDEKHNKVNIKLDFDFSRLPPPSELELLLTSKLEELTDRQKMIVECAAFVGYEFNAEILANVLKMDRLILLNELRLLESVGIVHDLINQDDVYAFHSTALTAAIRHKANIATVDNTIEIPQVVREYHHRVALSLLLQMENYGETLNTVDYNTLSSLARRSYAAGDRMLSKAFTYNSKAAIRAKKSGRYLESAIFASQAVKSGGKIRTIFGNNDYLEMVALQIEMGKILHTNYDEINHVFTEVISFIKNPIKDSVNIAVRIMGLWIEYIISLNNNELKQKNNSYAILLEQTLSDKTIDPIYKLFGELSLLRFQNKLEQNESLIRLISVYKNLDTVYKENSFALRLYSELLEDKTDLEISQKDYKSALITLELGIEIKNNKRVNDREGLSKLLYLKGLCYSITGECSSAIKTLTESLKLSEQVGALNHKINSATLLGKLYLRDNDQKGIELLCSVLDDLQLINDENRFTEIHNILTNFADKTNDTSLQKELINSAWG